MPHPLHIGIVACSAEGAALCCRTLCAEAPSFLGAHAHPEISRHGASLADDVRCGLGGDMQGEAALMHASARKLAAAGEIPLIIDDRNSALPTLDSTRPPAHAASKRAISALP